MSPGDDLLVLGAGPAGSALAYLAARAGLTVTILERERFPRNKVCGEFVSAEGTAALERLGALGRLRDAGAPWIDTFRLTDPRGRSIAAPLPPLSGLDGRALGISRAALDAELAARAVAAGARLIERATALAPILDAAGRVRGVRYREARAAGERRRCAAVVAACDGRRSCLVRALHPGLGDPSRAHPETWYGLKVHLDGPLVRLARCVEVHLFPGGYAGLSLVEDGRINLALVVTKRALAEHDGNPERVLRERLTTNPAVRTAIEGRRVVDSWKSVGPLRFGARKPAAAGALFVGDAAGTIDPLSGEGMSHALLAAEMAAPIVVAAAARGGLGHDGEIEYARRWTTAFSASTLRNRWLGRLIEREWTSRVGLGLLHAAPDRVVRWVVRASRTGVR